MLKRLSLISLILFGLACVFAPDASAQPSLVPNPKKNKERVSDQGRGHGSGQGRGHGSGKSNGKSNNSGTSGTVNPGRTYNTDPNKIPDVHKQEKDLFGFEGDFVWVDLGLPSGTKWATCNVGAYKPEECGNYYAWGELQEKTSYTEKTYTRSNIYQNNISGNDSYDVASFEWGERWQMPSKDDVDELRAYTTAEWGYQNGVLGLKLFSKKNDMYIFLPAVGYKMGTLTSTKEFGAYWTSTRYEKGAYCVIINASDKLGQNAFDRHPGFCVRPVLK